MYLLIIILFQGIAWGIAIHYNFSFLPLMGILLGAFLVGHVFGMAITSAIKNRQAKDLLNEYGIHVKTAEEFTQIEKNARENVLAPIRDLGIPADCLTETHSTLGICALYKNYLITTLEVASSERAPDDIKNIDPLSYIMHNSLGKFKHEKEALFSSKGGLNIDQDFDHMEKFIDHVQCVSWWSEEKIVLSSFRSYKIDDIEYYKIEGAKQYVSNVHGGGANLGGAVVGGIVAGDAGAVVGSRVGTEIKTDVKEEDHRSIVLMVNENGIRERVEVQSDDINIVLGLFRSWIPEKEYDYVIAHQNRQNFKRPLHQRTGSGGAKYSELKELKELADSGIISSEEFETKKRQILNL